MSRNELLNNVTHKDLKVSPQFSKELGDNVASTVTFITEFLEVQKEYPILFRKEENSNEYQAIVLFGIQKDENLFLSLNQIEPQGYLGWNARYIPAAVARGPFTIGFQTQSVGGEEKKVPVVHIDMEHPKVSTEEGVSIFLGQGGNSPYLERVSDLLNLIRDGMSLNKAMFDAFEKYQLIEDVSIGIELNNQNKHQISGFYTIGAERLSSLSGEALEELSRMGFLQAAFFVVASMSNIKKLIDIKNRLGGM